MNKNITLAFLILLFITGINGQTEYFVTVNPVTGVHTIIDSLPGVKVIQISPSCSTVDKTGNRYFFLGRDANNVGHIYTINANNGSILSNPVFPPQGSPLINPGNFAYDGTAGVIYGLIWDPTQSGEFFISINPATGVITNSVLLPGVTSIAGGQNTYDEVGKRFFFEGSSTQGSGYFTVNALTGSVTSVAPSTTLSIINARFNNTTGKLFGFRNAPAQSIDFGEVDPSTQSFTTVTNIPNQAGFVTFPNYATINESNNGFTFLSSNNPSPLITLSITNGSTLSSPAFPVGLASPTNNVIELRYNSNNNTLYGLHWGPARQTVTGGGGGGTGTVIATGLTDQNNSGTTLFDLFPNPAGHKATLVFEKPVTMSLNITSSTGALIRQQDLPPGCSSFDIETENLTPGVYFIELKNGAERQVKKLVIKE